MPASLKTIRATVSADGVVTTAEPILGPCEAVITLLVEDKIPNAVTRAAMDESTGDLPRYPSASQAKAALGI
jgi:hypothetical protein